MKIASWNVNSIRARAERIEDFLQRSDVDVLAIQETKAKDEQFPWEIFERIGYEVAHFGLNQWNGVALASRIGLQDVTRALKNQPKFKDVVEPRALHAECGDVTVYSLYVPNGRSLDDPHMPYKLQWLAALYDEVAEALKKNPDAKIVLAGDWNIAPLDTDVWDIKEFVGATHVSEPERRTFQKFLNLGFVDSSRKFYAGPDTYTYWDYKGLSFPKKKGMRIDFMLTSPAITVENAWVDREERKGKGASDHAPICMEILS
ncbi:MAG: exodeoxyribonuclease III [Micrococcaceae bacterium]